MKVKKTELILMVTSVSASRKLLHRDFLGAHRYTTEGGMCALRGPLHGAGCLTVSAIRGNNLSPSLHYPFMYFASDEGLKSRPSSSTKFFKIAILYRK